MSRSCAKCKDSFSDGEIIVPCICCLRLFHGSIDCTGATSTEVKVFKLSKAILVFRCQECSNNGGLSATYVDTLSQLKDVITSFSAIAESVKTMKQDIASLQKEMKALKHTPSSISSLKEDISSLKTSVKNLNTKPTDFADDVEFEVEDRINRRNNILIYGVQVPSEASAVSIACSALSSINNIKVMSASLVKVKRKQDGRGKDKSFVVAQLRSRSEVFSAIRARGKLPNGVSVSTDKTFAQRERISKVRAAIAKHNTDNPNDQHKLKFIKNVPTSVPVSAD